MYTGIYARAFYQIGYYSRKMLLTFLYMIATTIQTWRISSLRARLCALFQGTKHDKPSIMLYAKPLACVDEGINMY